MSKQDTSKATEARNATLEGLYEYQSLPGAHFARYLVLQPGSADSDPLVCTLHTSHLDQIPPFEAISYVWGTPFKNQSITCHGKVIRITINLCEALRQVRLAYKPRTLWMDSICINQADRKEQGHQVSLMGQIYKKSHRTLICLGVSNHVHARIVADLVADIDHTIQQVFEQIEFEGVTNSFPIPDETDTLISHDGWESFRVLLQQPWFQRGWVVQEAALGQDVLVLWADTDIAWLKILQAYIWYTRRALKLPNIQQLWISGLHLQGFYVQRRREAIQLQLEVGPLNLVEILESARWLGVTDPRDRIYAFLSLQDSGKPLLKLRPNYELPYIDIYRDFACEYLKTNQDLDILHFVHHDDRTLKCNFASWIPRWDVTLYSSYTGNLNNYNRYSERILSQRSSDKAIMSLSKTALELRAIIIDSVAFTGRAFDKNSTTVGDVASLWETMSTRSMPFPYLCSPIRAFVELFRCGVYRGRLEEWKTLESAYMQQLQNKPQQEGTPDGTAEKFHKMRMADVHNKSSMLSKRGYYGLAPKCVQEGDVCCIIFGTRSPFILRKTDRAGSYKLVGSVLILSKELDRNGYPDTFSGKDKTQDWAEWGLEEENIFLC